MTIDQRAAFYVGKWKADPHHNEKTLETWIATAIMDMRSDCAKAAQDHDKYDRVCYEEHTTGRCLSAQILKVGTE